ncbi:MULTISPECIES: helix-turn-helix domain-containing protein [Chryseobacterium]|uniref:AraC family transcriptional activator of pobA n=1 Tax=Chryseobacterium camelliae TaxID=1265445 RepID=A0ABU0TJJ8_9FLAO|nr:MULTISPECIES: helix-turn-helix transcriptional regulator [Chryseobacterium]MDT3409150.1 AraC family transcriptional activator of pobA [Pseudacidovorax intermedius]MDQ1096991.1 AraC family transcriptional activator of pobA [Chryseobacterium camelliae]MDQ1100931.1 AraC family transcriptional activator of pobA [Chryseobacterium sp. SORGH_AS_1048]MDR6084373.1 AraC family transcriptional activator of pobA [Chryseobacterium sp. SORGH_AS_0909]MDR6132644.1 AraC family transcriptional activator of p
MASIPNIKTYHFLPYKYGSELLIDIGRIETLKNYVLDSTSHQLSFYEIIFIQEGSGTFIQDENKISIHPQVIIFTSPGQVRRWEIEDKVKGYTLFFEKDFLHLFFSDELFLYRFQYFHQYSHPAKMEICKTSFGKCLELLHEIEQEFKQIQNDSNHLIRSLLYQLLIVLNRYYAEIYSVQRDTYVHPDFYRFRSLLEKRFLRDQTVEAYSRMLNVSPGFLNKICRQFSGLSAQQMIHYKLISEIKKQLHQNKSAKEISYELGFSDPSNFNRFFKKFTHTTPQQYRKNIK